MGKLSKKYTRTNKRKKKKNYPKRKGKKRWSSRRKFTTLSFFKVKTPTGKSIELSELFAESGKAIVKAKAIGEEDKEIDVKSQTIGDLKQKIFDSEKGYNWDITLNKSKPSWIMDTTDPDKPKPKPFTLFWKDKALLNNDTKLRDIIVDGERLPLYTHSKEIEPIVIKLDGTFDRSSIVETEVIKDEEFKDTPDE